MECWKRGIVAQIILTILQYSMCFIRNRLSLAGATKDMLILIFHHLN